MTQKDFGADRGCFAVPILAVVKSLIMVSLAAHPVLLYLAGEALALTVLAHMVSCKALGL